MIIAKIRVNGAIAKTVYRKVIPAGIIGAQVEFDYDEDIWHGLHKTVVFKGVVTKDVVTDANIVTIPHEVVEKPFFQLSIGVYGVNADGNIVIPTLWEDIGDILDATTPSGDTNNTDPSPPVWAQIQAMIGNLDELETTARDNLVAAVNEVAQSGGSASIAMRVDGGYIQYSNDNGKTWVNLIAEADLKGDKGDKGADGAPGAKGDPGTPGKDGTSITISGISESAADGGTNTVTFSDGSALNVKNGSKGSTGADGTDGITPHIGDNGNWYLGATDTGKPARGAAGSAGQAGKDGKSAYQYAQDGGYTGTEAEFSAKLAADKFANPNALTFTGAVTGSYDGSAPLSVEIPSGGGGTGGGSSGTWELIGEVTSDGTGGSGGIYVPIDFTQYKEVLIEAWIAADVINRVLMSSSTAWHNGQILNTNSTNKNNFDNISSPHTQNVLAQTIIYNICGELKPFSSWFSGFANGSRSVLQVSSARETYLATSYSYIRMDTNNNGAVAEGNWLKVWGRK